MTTAVPTFRVRLIERSRKRVFCVEHEPGLHSARYLVIGESERAFCGLDLPMRYRAAARQLWAGKREIVVEEVT